MSRFVDSLRGLRDHLDEYFEETAEGWEDEIRRSVGTPKFFDTIEKLNLLLEFRERLGRTR